MKLFVFALLTISAYFSPAQQPSDNSWLTGTWVGEGFGGTLEEVWSKPDANGTMMGMFRHFDGEGNMNFYEFWVLDSTGMKLKHFNPDLTGWEEKDKSTAFGKISFDKGKVSLRGLTYERISDSSMKISLDMKYKEGLKTEEFLMTKVSD